MRFVEVSTIEPLVLQEWHAGRVTLLARSTPVADQFKVQLRHGQVVLQPEFIASSRFSARLIARQLLALLADALDPSVPSIVSILSNFANTRTADDGATRRRTTTRVFKLVNLERREV